MKYNNIIYSQREPNYTDLWIKPDNSLHMFNNGAWKQIAGKVDISEVDLSGFVTKDDNPLYTTNISDGDIITGTTDVDFLHITKHDNQLGFGVNNATYNHWWKNNSLANMVKISDGGGLINLEVFYCGSTTYDDLKETNGWNIVPSNSLYAILEDYKNEVSNIPVITADNIEGSGFNLNGGLLNLYNCKIDIPDSDEKFYGYFAVMPQPQILSNSAHENGSNSPIYFKDNNLNTLSVYITPNSLNTLANLNNLYSRNLVTGEFLQTALNNVTDYVSKATTTKKGAMSSTDKTKLDGIAQQYIKNVNIIHNKTSSVISVTKTTFDSETNTYKDTSVPLTFSEVTSTSNPGLMSVADKHKVDAIPNTIISNITGNTDAPGEGFTLNITGTSIASDNIGRETESSITIPVASSSADGLLSSHDKGIIDAIPGTIVSKIINEKVNEELRISLTTRDINDGAWNARTEDIIIPYGQSTYNIGVINRDTDLVANETGVIYTNSMSISSETVDINQYNNILVKLTVPEGTLPVVCNLSGIGMTKRIFKSPDLYLNYGGVETRADLTITCTINGAEIIADFELVYYSGTGS